MFTREEFTSSLDVAKSEDHPGAVEAQLIMSSEAFELLDQLCMLTNRSMGDLIAKGIALMSVAAKAGDEGKVIGIGREGQPMETVIDVF